MLEFLPTSIDPMRYTEGGRSLHGKVSLAKMQRLASLLYETQGHVEAKLQFGKDEFGTAYVQGYIQTAVCMTCQRCLQPFTIPLELKCLLGLIPTERAADTLPEYYEPFIVSARFIQLSALIEDELILGLPPVPLHTRAECPEGAFLTQLREAEQSEGHHPFATLKVLRDKLAES